MSLWTSNKLFKVKHSTDVMSDLQDDKSDFIVRTRNILWREVARGGGSKELARAHVNLPVEAVRALELGSKGDTIAFIIRNNSKNVTLTNSFESQPTNATLEKDPQFLLERLLSQVLVLKSRKNEILERWENNEISDKEFTEKTRDIRNQLNRLTEDLRRIQETQFRGSSDNTDIIIDKKMQSDYNDYATGIMDYTEDLVSRIKSNKNMIDALNSAYSKGLFKEYEYRQEREELESVVSFLTDLSKKVVKELTINIQ
jgi:hypothetical protein